jgi:hypothetical protein
MLKIAFGASAPEKHLEVVVKAEMRDLYTQSAELFGR